MNTNEEFYHRGTEGTEMADEAITEKIIGAAIEVHRHLGPGLLESAYESCLCIELGDAGVAYERQKVLPVLYKERTIDCEYRLDVVVENRVIIELKSVQTLDPVYTAQVLSYLKMSGMKTGLLINFNVTKLVNGIKRIAN